MDVKIRGKIVDTVIKTEAFIQYCFEQTCLPTTKEALEHQLNSVRSNREQYRAIQLMIIQQQEIESRKEHEEEAMENFLSRCDSLESRILDLIKVASENVANSADKMREWMQAMMSDQAKKHEEEMEIMNQKLANISSQTTPPSDGQPKTTEETSSSSELNKLVELLAEKINSGRGEKKSLIKLPQMTLPTFSGKLSEWMSFKDQFTATIIENPDVSDAWKLRYLKIYTSDEAASVIKHLQSSDSNFEVAWTLLKNRFDKKYNIIMDHVHSFYSVPAVTTFNLQTFSQLCTTTSESVLAVRAMGVQHFDQWLIFHVLQKLDNETKLLWSEECDGALPTWDQFSEFLFKRRDNVAACGVGTTKSSGASGSSKSTKSTSNSHKKSSAFVATNSTPCKCCNETAHPLFRCSKFLAQSPDERFNTIKQLNLCRNCITSSHQTSQCQFRTCRKCNSRHNVLLHEKFASTTGDSTDTTPPILNPPVSEPSSRSNPTNLFPALPSRSSVNISQFDNAVRHTNRIFLATAVVDVLDSTGRRIQCRAMLDCGAQTSMMSSSLSRQLKLAKRNARVSLMGVGAHSSTVSHITEATMLSRVSDDSYNLQFLVVPKITGDIPNWPVNSDAFHLPRGITLADPDWHVQRPVDLLIGGDAYWDIMKDDTIELGDGMPKLKSTTLGHVIVGNYLQQQPEVLCHVSVLDDLNQTLKRFWEIEDVPKEPTVQEEHHEAEAHFQATHSRTPEGRFLVKLPFRKDHQGDVPVLGRSRPTAVRQLLALERRFERNPLLKQLYADVMSDHLIRGWLEPVPERELANYSYYMPHHGVLKESSSTRLRVVYNASSKTSNGLSLNDILLAGPTVHPDLFCVLLRFRQHPYAVMADITKMYLQLALHPEHTDFQRLVYRADPSQPIKDYRITRVCFGVTSSPFLATRALVQLAHEHQSSHPLATRAILNSFYVDDCIFSAETLTEAKETQSQLVDVMAKGGFVLAKWTSNHPDIGHPDSPESTSTVIQDSTKALGLVYKAASDTFHFQAPTTVDTMRITKRYVASAIAKLFDPLGLVSPVVVQGKMLLQELHDKKIGWDQEVLEDFLPRWHAYVRSVEELNLLHVRRWISQFPSPSTIEFHGFCDASMKAYGAAVYVVTRSEHGHVHSALLASKSKLAPLDPQTIPRLELCGALLLMTLMDKVRDIVCPDSTYLWTDSTIVLAWLNSPPDIYKGFVSRRVKQILQSSRTSQWRHVPTDDNPADIVSRGATPRQLSTSTLWWSGPHWITLPEQDWPQLPENSYRHTPEEAKGIPVQINMATESHSFFTTWMLTVSSLRRIQYRMAYVLRFLHNCRHNHHPELQCTGRISVEELERALGKLILLDQHQHFPEVIRQLQIGRGLTAPWKFLQSLSPYVDSDGLVRVGGRLRNSEAPFETKHPILLPKSKLQELIALREHNRLLHAPPNLLLASLRQKYWPISGKTLTRKIVRTCVTCIKARPKPLEQIMGDLPAHRVVYERPFYATGVDYAGPLNYKLSKVRNAKAGKVWICLFVCLSVKAIHLELVTDLTTEAFLAAFRRFVARRSAPRHMYSDCGTTFVGANRELGVLLDQSREDIADATAESGTIWHFNPPGAPHQGGLWEAGVKSVKHHLNRTLGDSLCTYEEMVTILYQIEATLNSRPLCLASEDPRENDYLTPGHFLVGAPLTAVPDPVLTDISTNRLGRWQRCQERLQYFSHRWRTEYLNTLQQRTKWKFPHPNIRKGDVALTLEDGTSKWILARIAEIHPGADGFVRVVTLRTSKGVFKRPVTKVAFLPVNSSAELEPSPGEDVNDVRATGNFG